MNRHGSPPKGWLGLRLRLGEKPIQEEKSGILCQHPNCPQRCTASKVCHHPLRQDLRNDSTLHLCESCDSSCHLESGDKMLFDRHPRIDLQAQGPSLARNMSTRSCPPRASLSSDLEEGDEGAYDLGELKSGPIKFVKRKSRRRYTDDPSKECFTLKFDLNMDVGTEKVRAAKKKTLREVLSTVFERKGIELSNVDLFLDQSNTPLSLGFEAYRFGGHDIRVRARPGEELRVERAVKDPRSLSLPIIRPSSARSTFFDRVEHGSLGRREAEELRGQVRRRKNMTDFLGDTNNSAFDSQLSGSLPNSSTGTDRWKNRAASRFSVLFSSSSSSSNGSVGKECDRLEQLQSKLHSYTVFGLPKMPPQLSFHRDSWEEEPNLDLEESWKELLDDPEMLTKRQCHQQEAIWELLQTESDYIKKLHVITDLFLGGLLNLQESGLLCEVEPARLFGNIQEIVLLHTLLWAEVLLPMLERARQNRAMLDPVDLYQGFSNFDYRFKPYICYCMEEEGCMEYMRTLLKDNELFKIYVTWAETNKQCSRLKLTDMLVKPHQRLTKYPLLLKSILKKTDEPAAREAVTIMVATVEGFINSVDSQMRQREEKQKLAAIASRIEAFEPVEGATEEVEKILRDYNQFDLMAPVLGAVPEETRQLYLEGALKMKEGKDSRMDVYCFLFTDVMLITKPVKRVEKVKVIRQPLIIRNVVCRDLKDPGAFLIIYLNEFRSAVASYCFQANSATQGCTWVEAINNAQIQLERLCSESLRDEEEEYETESSISTSSSPCLVRKGPLHKSCSNGSTETLSLDDPDEATFSLSLESVQTPLQRPRHLNMSSPVDTLSTNDSQALTRLGEPVAMEQDLGNRLLSIDSAYGTLSPESLITEVNLKVEVKRHKEEEQETEEEEMVFVEDDDDDDADDEDSTAWNGSQVTVNESNILENNYDHQKKLMESKDVTCIRNAHQDCHSLTLQRRSPVHPRPDYLQHFANRSRSEDDLLQRLTSPTTISDETKTRTVSKSLSQLSRHLLDSIEQLETEQGQVQEDPTVLSGKVSDALARAETRLLHRPLSYPSGQDDVGTKCDIVASQQPHLHRILTKAELQRMRTTMVLNSTLTAS
ncbi:pleckstrin homology domain-containing family G member 5 [Trichomycterus rosablanca]|uniref:pleckstrin homology domain-containing family G member 5 n=1 Tax=Trichomycterus rosablanca TaxID=2290929 RepID=UPI002F35FD83